jgi:hypothetical protein
VGFNILRNRKGIPKPVSTLTSALASYNQKVSACLSLQVGFRNTRRANWTKTTISVAHGDVTCYFLSVGVFSFP